jgi:dihydrofolate reductase
LTEARQQAQDRGARQVCVIGGGQIYAEALPLADELQLTLIDRDFSGSTRFPGLPERDFAEISRQRVRAAPPNDFHLDFVHLRRSARAPTQGT